MVKFFAYKLAVMIITLFMQYIMDNVAFFSLIKIIKNLSCENWNYTLHT